MSHSADPEKQTISILGCGWYGLPLAKKLLTEGYLVKGSSTSPEKLSLLSAEKIEPYLVNFSEGSESYNPEFFNTDILLISIPPKRSTGEQASFYQKISKISQAAIQQKVKHVIFISSTAVYGDHNTTVTENTLVAPDTDSGKAIVAAETLLLAQQTFDTTIIRFAGLVGPGRNPGRFFAGKENVANGQAPVNLIHLDDCIGFTSQLIKKAAFGHTYNACGPDHSAKQDFYINAAKSSDLVPPTFIDELQKWKIVSSTTVPDILNYHYQIDNWQAYLNSDK